MVTPIQSAVRMNTGPYLLLKYMSKQHQAVWPADWTPPHLANKVGAFKVSKTYNCDPRFWSSLWHPSRSCRSRRSGGHWVRSWSNWSYWRSGLNNLWRLSNSSKTKASLILTQSNPIVCEHLQHCCSISNSKACILFCNNSASTPKSLAKQSCATKIPLCFTRVKMR